MIMIAAALWALDALLRGTLIQSMPAGAVVFYEHLLAFILLSPLFFKYFAKYKTLSLKTWLVLLLLTIVSSALGTFLFTQALSKSFALYDFATPVLLLKLQPIFVIFFAAVFLREKLTWRYLVWVPVALIGSYLVSFGAQKVPLIWSDRWTVVALAVGAAVAWGLGTILSKKALHQLSFKEATVIRYALAVPVTLIFSLALYHQSYSPFDLTGPQILRLLIIALSTGAASIFIYYKGLQHTEAKVSTIAELTYPIMSILIAITALNPYGAPQKLTAGNGVGIVLLLVAILMISFQQHGSTTPQAVGTEH